MRRFILIDTAWGYEHGCHHGERTERRRHHIAHHIPVVVLTRPDKATLCLHDTCHRIIDQSIEIFNACRIKSLLIFGIIDLLEDILEIMVIFLGDRILRRKP